MQFATVDSDTLTLLNIIWESCGTELALLALFCSGFMLFRGASIQRFVFGHPISGRRSQKQKFIHTGCPDGSQLASAKELEANWAAGHAEAVLSGWQALDYFSLDALKAVVEAYVAKRREREVSSFLQQVLVGHENLRSYEAQKITFEALAACSPRLTGHVRSLFDRATKKETSEKVFHQSASTEKHAYSMRITSAAQSRKGHEVRQHMISMHNAGYTIPASCFVTFASAASDASLVDSTLRSLPRDAVTADAIIALFQQSTKNSNSELLRVVHQLAEERDLIQDPAVYESLLRTYAATGHSRAVEVFDDCISKGCNLGESISTAVVSLCAETRHVQMAEHVFKYARQKHPNAGLGLYSAMVKVYGCAKLFDKTCDMYDIMLQDGVEPDTVVYGSLIKAAVESGRLDLARRLFRQSGNPDLMNYMSLIRAAGREKDLTKALDLLDELEKSSLPIDATAYNCVLEVCASSGNREAATKLLKRMEEKSQVDVVSYNTYLKLLLADGARSAVEQVMQSMRVRGLCPNAVTYNSLVKDVVMRQDLHGAWSLIHQMEHDGIKPDAFTCSILMKGVRHSSSSEDVDKVVHLMQRAKVTPDEVLVNCLLDAYVRLRNIPRLVQVLEEFKSTGIVPSLHAVSLLIKAYGHSRRLDRAWALWHELIHERKVQPSEEVVASMVEACLAAGDLQNAVGLVRQMKLAMKDFARGPAVFGGVVKACISSKQAKLAIELYDELNELSFTCNRVTYNTIIDALVRQGDVDRAACVLREMSLRNVAPDLVSYATLIKGHCSKGCLEQGLQLLGLMQRRGISPDAIVFNSILDGCAHKQMRTLTEQVLKDMGIAGISPSNFTLSILVKLYGRCSDLDTAFHVVKTYPEKYKFKLNAQVYTCLMSACIANGSLPRALKLYRDMIRDGCKADSKMYQTLLNGCLRNGELDAASDLVNESMRQEPRVSLDHEITDSVLFMMMRRGRAADLGQPLLEQLESAGVRVSDRIRHALSRGECAQQHVRRGARGTTFP